MVNEGRSYNFAWAILFCNESSVSWNNFKLYYIDIIIVIFSLDQF